MDLYIRLYNATKENEEKANCPLCVCGLFCNTATSTTGRGLLDVEAIAGGSSILWDNDDLNEFLESVGISPEDLENELKKEV